MAKWKPWCPNSGLVGVLTNNVWMSEEQREGMEGLGSLGIKGLDHRFPDDSSYAIYRKHSWMLLSQVNALHHISIHRKPGSATLRTPHPPGPSWPKF